MPRSDLLRVHGAEQLRALSRDLRRLEEGKEVRRELLRELKGVAGELSRQEKDVVLAMPSKGENARRGRRSLRRRFATATIAQVRASGKHAGVSVLINPAKMPPGQQNLPAYMNAESRFMPLRHPVFGDTETWVSQPPWPWFYQAALPYEGIAQRRLIAVLDKYADQIERG